MSERPPFDPQRAAFLLIAFVIVVHAVVILLFAGACLWHAEIIITQASPDVNCDPNARLMGLLAAVLASALAFAGIKRG